MSPKGRKVCVGWFALHFCLITAFSIRDLVVSGFSIRAGVLPAWSDQFRHPTETVISAVLGERLPASNPLRQTLSAYANGAGIEAGYSYFAPSVPGTYKLVFELHYPNGRVEYDFPHVRGAAAGYRLATLLDILQQYHYAPLREAILKTLVYSVWQKHPDATMIRAVLAIVNLPTMAEFRGGTMKSYDLLHSYDFRFRSKAEDPAPR